MIDPAAARSTEKLALAAALGGYAALVPFAPSAAIALALCLPLVLIPLSVWTVLTPGRWIGLFLCAAILLPPLPFPIGDSGPHPALLFAALGLLSGLVRLERWRFQPDFLNCAAVAFFGMLLISVAPAAIYSGPALAVASLIRVCLFGISIYLFLYTRAGGGAEDETAERRLLRWVFLAAIGAAAFACVDFYFQFPTPAGFGRQFVWLDTGVYRRAQGLFYEASTLGNFCVFFLVMIAVALLRPPQERPLPAKVLVGGGVVFAVALVLSYSRASLVSLAVAMAALLALNRARLKAKRLIVPLLLGLPICAILAGALFPAFVELYVLRLTASAQYFFSSPGAVLSGRLATWQALCEFLAEHPWHMILGVGYKTLPYSEFAGGAIVADNMYLSLLVETGVLGLGALLLLCAAALRASLRAARSEDRERRFLGAWFFCFWIGQMVQMLSGDLLTYWRVLPIYFWVLAMAVRVRS
jgi:O-antigen ligase